jgi:hypothetical protein
MREYQVRICEGLGVKFPGPTRQPVDLMERLFRQLHRARCTATASRPNSDNCAMSDPAFIFVVWDFCHARPLYHPLEGRGIMAQRDLTTREDRFIGLCLADHLRFHFHLVVLRC